MTQVLFDQIRIYEIPGESARVLRQYKGLLSLSAIRLACETYANELFGQGGWEWVEDDTLAGAYICELGEMRRCLEIR